MFAGIWRSRNIMNVIMILLLAFFLGHGYLGADDVDFPDILTPGEGGGTGTGGGGNGLGGGGNGCFGDVEVYLGEGVTLLSENDPCGLSGNDPCGKLSGLAIQSVEGSITAKELPSKNHGIFYISPNPKIVLLTEEGGSAKVYCLNENHVNENHVNETSVGENAVVQGAFIALLNEQSHGKKIVLALAKHPETKGAVAVIQINGPGDDGAVIVLPNDGNLPLSDLLKIAFKAGVKMFSILQVEFDARGNILNKTAILVEQKESSGNAIYWGNGYGDVVLKVKTTQE